MKKKHQPQVLWHLIYMIVFSLCYCNVCVYCDL